MAVSDAAAAAPRRLERLQPRDAEGLCPLSIEAGWNQVAADWRLMLDLGWGYGVRGPRGQWIASALALPLGPTISWISMVLVTQPARGHGLGTHLLTRCIAEVEASGAAAGLDATELGRPIYLPLGFRDVSPRVRRSGPCPQRRGRRSRWRNSPLARAAGRFGAARLHAHAARRQHPERRRGPHLSQCRA